ncbi:MAG: MobF family relaxase [Terracoccus sp.]
MSIHKLTAGSGYDYLTRQVAAQDVTDKGHTGLASYYTAKGEAPGVWVGSGMAGIDGLSAGDTVTAEQMQALFGAGHHPLSQQRRDGLVGPDLTDRDYHAVTRLGAPYKVYSGDVSAFRLEVAMRIADFASELGYPADYPVPVADRARIRTEVAISFFRAQYGRDPEDAREIAATIAKHSRPKTTAVAGYDLTFSPVKSVSTLWAIADPVTAARIERAHQAAVKDALTFLEEHALYTRTGTNGVRQVDVLGLVATAFTHRDSRAGDPDLHTHVAVANKVQTQDGRWLSIDGRVLYKANVTASETYNTALEKHLGDDLNLRFEERPGTDARKRPVREVVGVDPALNERWSARRASIEARRGVLAEDFQRDHGRPPTPVESIQLAQRATLETREAKKEPRSLAEQRTAWREQARDVLGGEAGVEAMVTAATRHHRHGGPGRGDRVNNAWMRRTSQAVLDAVQSRRSTWQVWHVRAEAQRRVRGANLPAKDVEGVVDLLVGQVLDRHSIRLAHPDDGIIEPSQLRRRDDSSVYTVYGADQYTSARVLSAESRLIATAGRLDGATVSAAAVELALLESAANGRTLNAGQAALVRGMATSGARLQLAIAPAGAGKTTAMSALSTAWGNGGGTVIGLAPSAAAAAALRVEIGAHTDTLAKLTWSIEQNDLPSWAADIDAQTLVVIDEAGMADTLTLDTAVEFVTSAGGSVRLIGDDQQLAAIGAGGVLRDLDSTHGALRLTELMRFADPAEGAASLALREGATEALGFYLDHRRVHVGDLATMTEDVFAAWQNDRAGGLDALMLAPTRELVSELNQRARTHRLEGARPEREVLLADGNHASVGDLIITRANDRRLRVTASDWVKNGDRWSILALPGEGAPDGDLTVQHTRTGRVVTLPAVYVAASTELGYATTVHTAQGVTADTMHGLATGEESRQQIYTMMTRGRLGNHLYLQVVGDGDPHNAIRPDNLAPPTATDLLEAVLARDDSPVSASTMLADQHNPAPLLGQATARYVDALYLAAEESYGTEAVAELERAAEKIVPGLVDQAAWPTLRAHLILLSAHDIDPVASLRHAATSRELTTAGDTAAVLDWRLDDTGLRGAGPGPLPWIPRVPHSLTSHPTWGPYLTRRTELVIDLAGQVRASAITGDTPNWARQGTARPSDQVLGDVQVWRAAMAVPDTDRRPTGPPQLAKAPALWQRQLTTALTGTRTPAMKEWEDALHRVAPAVRYDDFAPLLAQRLAAMSRAGLDARALLRSAATAGPALPDDHAAAALWWRISRHLSPAVAADVDRSHSLTTSWLPQLTERLGQHRVSRMQASSWWPALVTSIDHALQRGWSIENVLTTAGHQDADVDECQAMIWRLSVLTDPPPADEDGDDRFPENAPPQDLWAPDPNPAPAAPGPWEEEFGDPFPQDAPPEDMDQGRPGPWDEPAEVRPDRQTGAPQEPSTPTESGPDKAQLREPAGVEADLQLAAMMRELMGILEPTDAQINLMVERAAEWDASPVTRERLLEVNQLTLTYYESRLGTAWARDYLTERTGQDLTGHPDYAPGYAPPGWTNLVTHLRRRGVSDEEMTTAGVATLARTGRLIDRFRDRAMLPIIHSGEVLGFVGRRHPSLTDQDTNAGPKYLNTADTPLFHKGAQLFGVIPHLIAAGATPVLVEGPLDAIAVTIASNGTHVGLAPLGTALTEEQAVQLARMSTTPVVATDADLAGRVSAERDFWMLAQHNVTASTLILPEGADPADVLARRGPEALREALAATRPLGETLLQERLTTLTGPQALDQASRVLAAQRPSTWDAGTRLIANRLKISTARARQSLHAHALDWNRDPRQAAQVQLTGVRDVKARLENLAQQTPSQRWLPLGQELDPRLGQQGDWPALAAMLHQGHLEGHDVASLTRRLVAQEPLGEHPAQDLRYRLAVNLPAGADLPGDPPAQPIRGGAKEQRRNPTAPGRAPAARPRR